MLESFLESPCPAMPVCRRPAGPRFEGHGGDSLCMTESPKGSEGAPNSRLLAEANVQTDSDERLAVAVAKDE